MKALILSGGEGARLRPITHTAAKQLIPVANKPILFYGIEAIKEAGISDVGIVVGNTHQEIKEAVGKGEKWEIKVTYIRQEAPLGLAHAVKVSRDFLKDEPFVMYLGDNIIKQGVKSLVREFQQRSPHSQILLAHVENPQQFGVAELKKDKVVKLVEKPKEPKTDLALVGVYMFDYHIFEAVDNIKPSWRNELEITDAIQYLIDKNYLVHYHIIDGWWKDTGKPEDLLEANRIMLDGLEAEIEGKPLYCPLCRAKMKMWLEGCSLWHYICKRCNFRLIRVNYVTADGELDRGFYNRLIKVVYEEGESVG